jgi:hypothetical protein
MCSDFKRPICSFAAFAQRIDQKPISHGRDILLKPLKIRQKYNVKKKKVCRIPP